MSYSKGHIVLKTYMSDINTKKDIPSLNVSASSQDFDSFVLDKSIFSKVFEKDIRRVYIYKKSERLAKAVHLICPAFKSHPALKDKIDAIAIGLVEAAILSPTAAREALSRELLALSSVLSIAKAGGALSSMNAELIAREAHMLLQEIAMYEEPRVAFDQVPSFSAFLKSSERSPLSREQNSPHESAVAKNSKGQIKDKSSRRETILSILRTNGPLFIKDISMTMRDVGGKTVQRELQALVASGMVKKEGDKRWTKYSLAV